MSQVRTAVRGQVRSAIRGNVGNPVGFSAPFYDGIHLDFRTGRHYVKVPGGAATVGAFTSLFTFTGDNLSYYRAASGLYVASVTNAPRIEYDASGNLLGLLIEGSRINQLLQARDQTNASWVKTTMTAAKDQVGEDGVTNSASSLTATNANATSLQTIVQAAVNSTLSFSIKRLIGAGTIGICQDGVTFTDVTAQVNSSTYTRVTLTASQLNPALGIRLGTNGDKIAVDFGGFEAGAFASSRIPTTTVAVTRAADSAIRTLGAEYKDALPGTLIAEAFVTAPNDAFNSIISLMKGDNTTFERIRMVQFSANGFTRTNNQVQDTGALQADLSSVDATRQFPFKTGLAWAANDFAAYTQGVQDGVDGTGTVGSGVTDLRMVGGAFTNDVTHIRRLDYYPTRLANNVLQQMTA